MRKFVVTIIGCCMFCCCIKKDSDKNYPSPKGYDLSNPVILNLRSDLDEISGIQFYPKDTSIFAINDEFGVLYKIIVRKNSVIKTWKFSSEGDYEDVVLLDSTFYTLQSNGDIKAFRFSKAGPFYIETFRISLTGNNDFESLYYDKDIKKLVLICKDCAEDTKKTVSAFAFDPLDNTFSKDALYEIDAEEVADISGDADAKFKPSAAAIHPFTGELYIISSVAGLLAIAETDGTIKSTYKLNPRFFKQPEGISFTNKGDLLISNEAADIGTGNILIFKYKPLVHEKE